MLHKNSIAYIKYFYLITFSIFIFTIIAIYNLSLYKEKIEQNYYESNIISQKIAYNSSFDKFTLMAKYIFDKEINRSDVLENLDKAINSKNENEKRYYKGIFYRNLNPTFEYIKKIGIRQLHFQTSDNKSFLRFHNPSKYNDDLTKERLGVKYVNEKKVPISLFETGRVLSGFRNIFPIFYGDKYLGSVEVSLTLKSMVDSLEKLDNRKEYKFILNKKLIESKVFEYQKYLYTNSLISDEFVEEDTNSILPDSPKKSSDIVNRINKKISKNKEIQKALKQKEYISSIIEVDNQKYDIVLMPLLSIDETLEGYIISYSKAINTPIFLTSFSYILVAIILGTFLILFLLKLIKDKSENLSNEKNWYNQISESISEGLFVTNKDLNIEYINSSACKILGYEKEELIGKNAHYLFHYHERNSHSVQEKCPIVKAIKENGKFQSENEFFRVRSGKLIPIDISVRELSNKKGYHQIVTFRDLSIKKELEIKQNLLKTALNSCSDSIVITDIDANIIWANPAFEKLTGYELSEVQNKKPSEFVKSGLQTVEFYEEMWNTILNNQSWKGELVNRKKDGTLYNEELSITPVLDDKSSVKYFIAIKQDITDKKIKEKEIEHSANYDFLTNLPNRRMFNFTFKRVLESLKNEKRYVALLFLDLDKFKILNDTKGHDYGDILLKEFSSRVKKTVRHIDFVARLGGDEFVIILDNLTNNLSIAEKICVDIAEKILANTKEPFLLKDYSYTTSTSIGIYLFNTNSSLEKIIKRSDEALYCAKNNGRDRYCIFNN